MYSKGAYNMNEKTQLILNFINESSSNMPYVLKDKLIRDGKKIKV